MDITAAIQYILTAAQSLGSQVYFKKSLMAILRAILRLAGVLFCKNAKTSRRRQNGLSDGPKKILTWKLREARGGLKATICDRVKRDYHFIRIVLFFSVSFSQILVFPSRLCSKGCQHILDIVGLSQAEV